MGDEENMQKRGRTQPRPVNDRRHVAQIVCGEIENATKDWHAPLPEQKHVTRWRAGTCTICGEWSTYISQDHAHRHGYKNADEMAHAGVMHWTE